MGELVNTFDLEMSSKILETIHAAAPEEEEEEAPAEEEEPAEEEAAEEEEEEEEEEDLVDPHDTLKEKCDASPHCAGLKGILAECTERVEGKSETTETCFEEMIDFLHCVDHCVQPQLFKLLK